MYVSSTRKGIAFKSDIEPTHRGLSLKAFATYNILERKTSLFSKASELQDVNDCHGLILQRTVYKTLV